MKQLFTIQLVNSAAAIITALPPTPVAVGSVAE